MHRCMMTFDNTFALGGERDFLECLLFTAGLPGISKKCRAVISRNPWDVLWLGRNIEIAKEIGQGVVATHIVMLRDPRDLWCSKQGDEYIYHAHHLDLLLAVARQLEETADSGRVVPIRYEDLVAGPDNVQEAIGEALGLTHHCPFSESHAMGRDIGATGGFTDEEPVYLRAVGRHKGDPERMEEFWASPVAREVMRVFPGGYE